METKIWTITTQQTAYMGISIFKEWDDEYLWCQWRLIYFFYGWLMNIHRIEKYMWNTEILSDICMKEILGERIMKMGDWSMMTVLFVLNIGETIIWNKSTVWILKSRIQVITRWGVSELEK